ncbi:divalent cation tolerance protein CutA [Flavobacterium sp. LaA7.5]|nr:divalent cation tolerance protein CutA [Flavobacterium salilacus subsp. altitudinum]
MVCIIIYLEQANEAKELTDLLLMKRLIANASIDKDNVSYNLKEGKIVENINYVITAQTKMALFYEIEELIAAAYGEHIPIFSIPIIHANHSFDTLIRSNTIPTT